ncbi:MAG: Asp-tRNA(Asn)/Glu-tRNA(Gln) amidotransferase subunit GatC [bacterium]|nr:Asp-tRNA(Asn)/Glu-tRNA(Gln) amidotransferase subunit GatC [bacterium]
MIITSEVIRHIAKLARIELTDAEVAAFPGECSAILNFVATLERVATDNVEPLSGGHDLSNVMREDGTGPDRNVERGPALVDAAPQKRDGYVEVRAVFDRE